MQRHKKACHCTFIIDYQQTRTFMAQMSPAGGGSRGWGNPITHEGFGKLDTTGEG